MGSCAECGRPLGRGQDKYCSRDCAQRARTKAAENARRRVCEYCGKEFIMRSPSGKANRGAYTAGRFCSRKCYGLWRRAQEKPEREVGACCNVFFKRCVVCGVMFAARLKYKKYCSDKCRYNETLKRLRDKYVPKPGEDRVCVVCGKVFHTSCGLTKKTCSAFCGKRLARMYNKPKSRARKFGVEYENVNPVFVFERDGWRCQICGKKTPRRNRGTRYPNAPEIDHRIPLSLGGPHTYKNVQCACRRCNIEKSNNDCRGQLPMFQVGA